MFVSTFAQTYLETARRDRYERASKLPVYYTEHLEMLDSNNQRNNNLYDSLADKYFLIILGYDIRSPARVIRRQARLCL